MERSPVGEACCPMVTARVGPQGPPMLRPWSHLPGLPGSLPWVFSFPLPPRPSLVFPNHYMSWGHGECPAHQACPGHAVQITDPRCGCLRGARCAVVMFRSQNMARSSALSSPHEADATGVMPCPCHVR